MLQENLFFARWIVQIQQHFVLVLPVPGPVFDEVRHVERIHEAGEIESVFVDGRLLVRVGVPLDWKQALI